MGWSLDLLEPKFDAIFEGIDYTVSMPESTKPYVHFNYETEINVQKKKLICDLFPPEVYVFFHPDQLIRKKKQMRY